MFRPRIDIWGRYRGPTLTLLIIYNLNIFFLILKKKLLYIPNPGLAGFTGIYNQSIKSSIMQPKFTLKKKGNFFSLTPKLLILFCFFAVKTNAQPCNWTASTVYPITVLDQAVATVGTNLYSFSGVSNGAVVANSYKFDGTVWTPIAPLPIALEYPAAVTNGTDIFILGGVVTTPVTNVWRYNVATNTYTALAPFTTGTWNHVAVFLNGKIHKFAGTGPGTAATSVHEIYDIATNTWSAGAAFPQAVSFASGYAQGGFIWAAGGYDGVNPVTKAYRYDPVANSWNDAAMADLPVGRWGAAYGFYNNGFVMAGGYVGTTPSNTAVSWEMATNSWSNLPNMLQPRARMNGGPQGLNFHVIGGRSVVAPGTGFTGTNDNQQLNCIPAAPCTGTPNPGNTISTPNPVCPNVNFTLSTQNPTPGSGVFYQWQSSPDGTNWTDIPFATGASYVRQQTVATYYRVRVTCNANIAFSTPLQVTMAPLTSCYCIPTYTNGCTLGDYIARVRLVSIDNSTLCSTPPFTYYSAIPAPTLIAGATYPLIVTVGPDTFGQWVAAWADLNQDGDFNDAGEFLAPPVNAGASGTVTLNITIPTTATIGTTRLRIRGGDDVSPTSGQSCGASNSTYGEAEDYNINIAPCIQGVFTAHPTNTTAQCSGTASFSVSTTGSALTFLWEMRPNAVSPWVLVTNGGVFSGATTNTLTLTGTPSTLNGYQFRAIMQGPCTAPDFSNAATLTVGPLVASVSPASATICSGTIQAISLTNVAAPVQVFNEGFDVAVPLPAGWAAQNRSVPLGTTGWFQGNPAAFTSHSGAGNSYIAANYQNTDPFGVGTISNWLFAPPVTLNNGNTFTFWTRKIAPDLYPDRLQVWMNTANQGTNVGATATSTGDYTTLLLDINPTLIVGVYPIAWTQYTVTISGLAGPTPGRLAFRYFVTNAGGAAPNSDFIGIDDVVYTAGALAQGTWTSTPAAPNTMFTNPAATVPYVAGTPVNTIYVNPTVTTTYFVTYSTTSPACVSAPTPVVVNVVSPVGAITQPTNKSACVGGSTTFTASAVGGPFTYQWEVSTNGGASYTPISGATTSTLTLTNITQTMNNYRYRLVFNAAACASTATSTAAILTVNPLPTVTISSPNLNIVPGVTTTITASSTPAAASGTSWTWFYNGSQIITTPATNTNTISVGIDALGTYQARVVDVNGCVNLSNELVIGAQASDKLWIYPNPTDGQFQVRVYYDGPYADIRHVMIYDESGRLVMRKAFDLFVTQPPYLQMSFDMSAFPAGTYVVKVEERFTGKIKSGLLVIQ